MLEFKFVFFICNLFWILNLFYLNSSNEFQWWQHCMRRVSISIVEYFMMMLLELSKTWRVRSHTKKVISHSFNVPKWSQLLRVKSLFFKEWAFSLVRESQKFKTTFLKSEHAHSSRRVKNLTPLFSRVSFPSLFRDSHNLNAPV